MKNCPWCSNKAVVRNSCLGYFVECEINGHIHNIGVFENVKDFSKTKEEAIKEWDNAIDRMNL